MAGWSVLVGAHDLSSDGFTSIDGAIQIKGLASPTERKDDLEVLGVSGAGVVGSRFVVDGAALQDVIDDHGASRAVDVAKLVRGSLNFVLWESRERRLSLVSDPLGGAFIYMWTSVEFSIFSTDLSELVSTAKRLGVTIGKSLRYLASVLVTGNGGFYPSSFEGVEVMPQYSYGQLTGDKFEVKRIPEPSYAQSYEEQIHNITAEIGNNVTASSNYTSAEKIVHLTGGFDSRLVLAALLNSDLQDTFEYFCSGPAATPDRIIHDGLVGEFGLVATSSPGFDSEISFDSHRSATLAAMRWGDGMLSNPPGLGIVPKPGGSVILSGGYGEILRSFYGTETASLVDGPRDDLLKKAWGLQAFGASGQRLLSENLLEDLRGRIDHEIESRLSAGIREDAVMDHIYLSIRNRYFVGQISSLVSRRTPRFDPLYSINAAGLVMTIPVLERSSNIVGFDVMDRFTPGLKSYPFDRSRFNETYETLRGKPRMLDFSLNAKVSRSMKIPNSVSNNDSLSLNVTPEHIQKANRLRASVRQVALLEPVQAELRELVAGIGRRRISEHFDYVTISRLISTDLNHRVHVRRCHALYALLLWFYEG